MMLSLVVPCFNEEGNVEQLFEEIKKVFTGFVDYEIVFVDDGSRDKTRSILKKVYNENKALVQLVSFSRNFGKFHLAD